MKNGMTKAERLKAYKNAKILEKKAAEAAIKAAKYLADNCEVHVTNWDNNYCHDVVIVPTRVGFEDFEDTLKGILGLGEIKLVGISAGRLTFSPSEFFHWVSDVNPNLGRVIPSWLRGLPISYKYEKEVTLDNGVTAAFKVVAL